MLNENKFTKLKASQTLYQITKAIFIGWNVSPRKVSFIIIGNHITFHKIETLKKYHIIHTVLLLDFSIVLRISWVLTNIAYPVAIVVTIIYWTLLFKGLTGVKLYNSINTHALQVINEFRPEIKWEKFVN